MQCSSAVALYFSTTFAACDIWTPHLKHDCHCPMSPPHQLFVYENLALWTCFSLDILLQGYANADQEMGIILQGILAKNYPKVRKGLYVFPINWFVQLFWDTLLKPLLATLQPDIEDKVCERLCGRCKLLLLFSAAHNLPWPSFLFLTCPLLSKSRQHAPTRMHPRTKKKYAHRSAR